MEKEAKSHYAQVNGLRMYYEIHGSGEPLVLLHGQFAGAAMSKPFLQDLSKNHQLIIPEQQGHGHTADIEDRLFSFAQMADDTAELLRQLDIERAQVFGYSGGGSVALQLALRHPKLVSKLALASAACSLEGYVPGIEEGLRHPDPDAFPPIVRQEYEAVAPHPENWPKLVYKMADMINKPNPADSLTIAQLQSIKIPVLLVIGDQDIIRPEHAEEMAKAMNTEVTILPGDHVSYISFDTEPLNKMLREFFA